MDTKNNSGTNVNILTKSDKESNFPINFRPLPKRYVVWNEVDLRFMTVGEAYPLYQLSKDEKDSIIFSLQDLIALFNEFLYYDNDGHYIVCQSTNLFDEDGEEIFEGSIVPWNEDTGVVEWRNGKWVLPVTTSAFSVYHELGPNADMVKVIGHILWTKCRYG